MKIEFYGEPKMDRDEAGRYRRLDEHEVPVSVEDGGWATIAQFGSADQQGVFVRVQSWDETKEHAPMRKLIGHRVKVTVEIVD